MPRPDLWLPAVALAVLICTAPAGRAQDEPEKLSPAAELLDGLGVRANPEPGVKNLLDQYAKAHPDVPHDFWRALYEYHSHPGRLRDALAAIVERDLTAEEIDTALAFFRSDLGQKVIQIRATLAEESKGVARTLADEFRTDVRGRLKKAGHLE